MIYFTSDTHFAHVNIIKYCDRPWKTVDAMNAGLIERWNSVVDPDDDVYHLGDFCMGGSRPKDWLPRLNGNVHLICGNHDPRSEDQGFASVHKFLELKVKGYRSITLCHFPLKVWNRSHKGTWHLFGHVHGTMTVKHGRITLEDSLAMDVGVDCHNYYPVSIDKVAKIMDKKARSLKEKFKKEIRKGGLSNKEISFRKRIIEGL